jgi:hypothetical protein
MAVHGAGDIVRNLRRARATQKFDSMRTNATDEASAAGSLRV